VLIGAAPHTAESVTVLLLSLHVPSFEKVLFSFLASEETHQGKHAGALLCAEAR
jgi:hypothetical protein